MGKLPAFYTDINSPRYGDDAAAVYHDESACWRGQRIVDDHTEVFGDGGRGTARNASGVHLKSARAPLTVRQESVAIYRLRAWDC